MARFAEVYLLGDIALASEFPLPELPALTSGAAQIPQVDVRLGVTPFTLSKSVEIDPDCFASSSQYLLRVKGVGSYLVTGGTEIIVEPDEAATALDVRAYLLGTVFSVLCHQRGLLPLHASAVSTANGVVAFLARSGQGKSSLAAHLSKRGFSVAADDICLVDSGVAGVATVIPSAPWLKLWRSSLHQLGQSPEGLEQVFSEDDKYRLPVANTQDRRPIDKLVFLEWSEDDRVEIQKITGIRALVPLMNLVHQACLLEAMLKREEVFRRCGQILSQAKAYRLIRPRGFEYMESAIDRIEALVSADPVSVRDASAPEGVRG